jgi:hypothetical protein
MLHGTHSFNTLIVFGHPHQKDKNLKSYHRFLLLKKSRHHHAISPFVLFFAFALEATLFSSLWCASPL